jgi:hypothetical protein
MVLFLYMQQFVMKLLKTSKMTTQRNSRVPDVQGSDKVVFLQRS